MFQAFTSWLIILAQDPIVRSVQAGLICLTGVHIYVIFYVLRDVLLRCRSVTLQLVYLVLVAVLPGLGFLLYILVRPAQTHYERRLLSLLEHSLLRKHIRHHTAKKLRHARSTVVGVKASK